MATPQEYSGKESCQVFSFEQVESSVTSLAMIIIPSYLRNTLVHKFISVLSFTTELGTVVENRVSTRRG